MGAVLHTVNPPALSGAAANSFINHAEDKLLFVDPTLLPALAPLAGKLPTVEKTIVMTSAQAMPAAVKGTLPDYESFIAGHADTFDWPRTRRTCRELTLLHVWHDRQPEGCALQPSVDDPGHAYGGTQVTAMGLSCRDTVLAVVPMFHANAWACRTTRRWWAPSSCSPARRWVTRPR